MSKRRLPRAVFIGRCCLCERVVVGDPSGFKHVPPMPRCAGSIEMSFGFGSRHDVCTFDGLICDDCAEPFKERMVTQSRARIGYNRAVMIRRGARFATQRELRKAFATPFTMTPKKRS